MNTIANWIQALQNASLDDIVKSTKYVTGLKPSILVQDRCVTVLRASGIAMSSAKHLLSQIGLDRFEENPLPLRRSCICS